MSANGKNIYNVGFFGAGNFGDELLCQSILALSPAGSRHIIASAIPSITRSNIQGNYSIARGLFPNQTFYNWFWKRIFQIRSTDELLLGGGGLFNRAHTDFTIYRYALEVALAVYFNKPFKIIGIEIGDYKTSLLLDYTKFCIDNAQLVYCRDNDTASRARKIGSNPNIITGPDISMGYLGSRQIAQEKKADQTKYALINSVALHRKNEDHYNDIVENLLQHYPKVIISGAQSGEADQIRNSLKPAIAERVNVSDNKIFSDTLDLYSNADLLIAERFHGVMAGIYSPHKLVVIKRTSKVRSLCEDFRDGLLEFNPEELDQLTKLDPDQIPDKSNIESKRKQRSQEVLSIFNERVNPKVEPFQYAPSVRREALAIIKHTLAMGLKGKWKTIKNKLSPSSS